MQCCQAIECVRSCDQKPHLHNETKGGIRIKIEFNPQKNISLLQDGHRFFVYSSNMAAMTSCEHTLYLFVEHQAQIITMVSLEAPSHVLYYLLLYFLLFKFLKTIYTGVISKNVKNKKQQQRKQQKWTTMKHQSMYSVFSRNKKF